MLYKKLFLTIFSTVFIFTNLIAMRTLKNNFGVGLQISNTLNKRFTILQKNLDTRIAQPIEGIEEKGKIKIGNIFLDIETAPGKKDYYDPNNYKLKAVLFILDQSDLGKKLMIVIEYLSRTSNLTITLVSTKPGSFAKDLNKITLNVPERNPIQYLIELILQGNDLENSQIDVVSLEQIGKRN
jgi:hypothetical protein